MAKEPPETLIWIVTGRCNLRCPYCYAELYEHDEPMKPETALRVIDEAAEAGVEYIQFTGGEPLLYRGLDALVSRVAEHGIRVSVFTNMTLLGYEAASRLARLGAKLYTSLDGAREVYEAAKGPGTWSRFMKGLEAAKRAGAGIHINIPLSRHNYRRAGEALRLAVELGAESVSAIPTMASGRARRTGHYIRPHELLEALRSLEETAEELGIDVPVWCTPFIRALPWAKRLHSGNCRDWSVMDIAPNGDVLVCDVMGVRVANVAREGLLGAWERLRSSSLLGRALQLPAECRRCPAAGWCRGGCYARAYLEYGRLPAPDPLCPLLRGKESP